MGALFICVALGEKRMDNKSEEYLRSLAKLFQALKSLNFNFDNFECSKRQRIIFQKLVYALQRGGLKLGYNYNLYINGPYCPNLADDGYFIARNLDDFETKKINFNFSESGQAKITNAKKFISNKPNDSNWLETLCTVDYLCQYKPYKMDKGKIFSKFNQLKPHLFDPTLLDTTFEHIRNYDSV